MGFVAKRYSAEIETEKILFVAKKKKRILNRFSKNGFKDIFQNLFFFLIIYLHSFGAKKTRLSNAFRGFF